MTPHHWIVQYYGYDYMQNTFEKYESPEQYQYTADGRLKAYQTLARLLKGKTANGEDIALAGSKGFTAQGAQRQFIQGKAAMVTCGPWFPTEMSKILIDYPDFEFGYIPLPHINADKKDVNGQDSSGVGYSLAANLLAIPANSKNVDVAKDFLLSMFTSESYATFVNENSGTTRPITVEIDVTSLSAFAKEVYAGVSASKLNGTCVYETSSSPMSINGYLGIVNISGSDAILEILNATSYDSAMAIASRASAKDYETALSFWDTKKNAWKEEFIGIK
jgi:ABC-type glycerol-3-phosphate transport system substrate-binding protein